MLPITVHGCVSDIYRSYVAQRLLWDAGYAVAFSPPMVNQYRSPHNYLADMQVGIEGVTHRKPCSHESMWQPD